MYIYGLLFQQCNIKLSGSTLLLLTACRSAMALSASAAPVPCLKATFLWMLMISPSHLPYAPNNSQQHSRLN
jgi:hypothetical protein